MTVKRYDSETLMERIEDEGVVFDVESLEISVDYIEDLEVFLDEFEPYSIEDIFEFCENFELDWIKAYLGEDEPIEISFEIKDSDSYYSMMVQLVIYIPRTEQYFLAQGIYHSSGVEWYDEDFQEVEQRIETRIVTDINYYPI